MRFLIVPPEQMMVVDNATVHGMDLSALTTAALVIWNGTSGEIEPINAVPVRTSFQDPTPYLSYVNSWIAAPVTITEPPLLDPDVALPLKLAQAKSIKIDLIENLFAFKRQAPITWSSWTWDASDESLRTMLLALIPVNRNAVITLVNDFNNQMAGYNNNLTNNYANYNASWVTNYPSLYKTFGSSFNTVGTNYGFQVWSPTQNPPVPNLPGNPDWGGVTYGYIGPFQMPGIGAIANPMNSAGSITWLPYNADTGIVLTYSQLGTIATSIVSRRNSLLAVRETKRAQVQALTTIAAVAAYDITTGW